MSRYIMIRRLRGPAFLLLVGVNALLAQSDILGWDKSWPLYLILWGVLALAERAAMASEGGYPAQTPYPGASYPGQPYSGQQYPGQPYAPYTPAAAAPPAAPQPGAAIVPVQPQGLTIPEKEGGQQ